MIDEFVDSLLEHQKSRVEILNKKYEPALSELNEDISQLKKLLGIEEEEDENMTDDPNDDDDDNEDGNELIATGSKRKGKSKKNKNNKR